ncbi:MAG: glycosyltransferase family 4 protein [Anaerolineales bacterium]|nr:glycosyltransferase family 4 protein [Anaerolineales bacterium]
MHLIQQLSPAHEFQVLTPLHTGQETLLETAQKICPIEPVWLPETQSQPQPSRLANLINGWRQALLETKPRQAMRFFTPQLEQAITARLARRDFDLLQVQQLHIVQYLPRQAERRRSLGRSRSLRGGEFPTVLDVDNLWSKLLPRQAAMQQETRLTHRLQTALDLRKVPGYERQALQRFDGLLAISEQEAGTLSRLAPKARLCLAPNGVDCDYFSPRQALLREDQPAGQILYLGTMSYLPNIDAVQYFSAQILPLIRQNYPQVVFQVAGRDPAPELRTLTKDPYIQVSGFVEDIRPSLASCSVFVVPLRAGAGTRLKILEALAMGKAVVSTTIGAEGLNVTHEENILIADQPAEFARQTVRLLAEPELRNRLGQAGRRLVERQYSWGKIAAGVGQLYQALGESHQEN